MYLLVSRQIKEKISGYGIICNEIMTCTFYIILALPYISNANLTKADIRNISIYVIIGAFICSIISNFAICFKKLVNWVRERREKKLNKVVPFQTEDNLTIAQDNITSEKRSNY